MDEDLWCLHNHGVLWSNMPHHIERYLIFRPTHLPEHVEYPFGRDCNGVPAYDGLGPADANNAVPFYKAQNPAPQDPCCKYCGYDFCHGTCAEKQRGDPPAYTFVNLPPRHYTYHKEHCYACEAEPAGMEGTIRARLRNFVRSRDQSALIYEWRFPHFTHVRHIKAAVKAAAAAVRKQCDFELRAGIEGVSAVRLPPRRRSSRGKRVGPRTRSGVGK